VEHTLGEVGLFIGIGILIGMWIVSAINDHHQRNHATIMVSPRIGIEGRVLRASIESYLKSLKWKLEMALKDAERGVEENVPYELLEKKTPLEREQWIRHYWITTNIVFSRIDERITSEVLERLGHNPRAPYESKSPHPIFKLG